MNRREALTRVAGLMGGTLSASALLAIRKGLAADTGLAAASTGLAADTAILSASQRDIVSGVVDIIIPRTDTPGAVDVGVPGFIDLMLRDVYTPADRDRYLAGLTDFDATAVSENGKKFLALELQQQVALVRRFHHAAVGEERRLRGAHAPLQRPFILMTKELTLLGFFTSQVGATQVLQYVAVPGSYHGCIPVEEAGNGKTWAFEPGIKF